MSLVGMLVFGGTDPETGCKYRNASAAAFWKANNLEARKKVGAAPLTIACLDDSKVWHEMGADEYEWPMLETLQYLQAKNDASLY